MGPPWGAFCQITLTSCYNIKLIEPTGIVLVHIHRFYSHLLDDAGHLVTYSDFYGPFVSNCASCLNTKHHTSTMFYKFRQAAEVYLLSKNICKVYVTNFIFNALNYNYNEEKMMTNYGAI